MGVYCPWSGRITIPRSAFNSDVMKAVLTHVSACSEDGDATILENEFPTPPKFSSRDEVVKWLEEHSVSENVVIDAWGGGKFYSDDLDALIHLVSNLGGEARIEIGPGENAEFWLLRLKEGSVKEFMGAIRYFDKDGFDVTDD